MNWEAIGAVGEIVGAAAVVVTLVYLARQIGQHTAMTRVAASSERVERDYEIASSIIESREVAEIWAKGDLEFDSLDDIDRLRLMFFERRAIVLWHHLFRMREQNLLTDSDWHEHRWIMQNFGRRRAVREAWRMFRDAYERPFQDFLDGQFSIADSAEA